MKRIYRFLARYPFTLLCVGAVWYLSLYRVTPPPVHLFSWFDKLVHFCMYAGISTLTWAEYGRCHTTAETRPVLLGAVLAPILMGGLVELAQAYLTTYRTGDWFDFLANALGVLAASALCTAIYTRMRKWKRD